MAENDIQITRIRNDAELCSEIRKDLFRKLKKEHCFWSYDPASVTSISDELLIELVMMHLDLDDIDKLFWIFPKKKVKQCWLERLVPQGDRLYPMNVLFAIYYFKIKRPNAYVKAMGTRYLNKISK